MVYGTVPLSPVSPSKCYDLDSTEPINTRLAGGPLLFASSEHSTLPRLYHKHGEPSGLDTWADKMLHNSCSLQSGSHY